MSWHDDNDRDPLRVPNGEGMMTEALFYLFLIVVGVGAMTTLYAGAYLR